MCFIEYVLQSILHVFKTLMKVIHGIPKYIQPILEETDKYDSGYFNWRDFYTHCLGAANAVPIDQELDDNQPHLLNSGQLLCGKKKAAEAGLRFAMEQCLQYKRKITYEDRT